MLRSCDLIVKNVVCKNLGKELAPPKFFFFYSRLRVRSNMSHYFSILLSFPRFTPSYIPLASYIFYSLALALRWYIGFTHTLIFITISCDLIVERLRVIEIILVGKSLPVTTTRISATCRDVVSNWYEEERTNRFIHTLYRTRFQYLHGPVIPRQVRRFS